MKATIKDDTCIFEPHYGFGITGYSWQETISMYRKISFFTMLTDPWHQESMPWFFRFRNMTPMGEPAPDFTLPTTDGGSIQLSKLQGKIVVFMFAAITCPPACAQVPPWNALRKEYAEKGVELFIIYSRERHPGEPGYREFTHTTTDDEKMNNAVAFARDSDIPVAVDGIDEAVLAQYGKVPNAAFVVDRQGRLVFKSTWANANELREVVDCLLSL